MASHDLQFVATQSNATKPIRDIRGNERTGANGTLMHGLARTGCLGRPAGQSKVCARVQGFEAVSAPGVGAMYYVWPGENHKFGEQGFIAASDLKAVPALRQPEAPLGEPLGAAPGSPSYRVVVRPIHNTQGYTGVKDGLAHTFAPYGQASAYGGDYTLMTYNWTDVAGGGIARAAVAGGETFYPSDIDPLTVLTYPVTEVPGSPYVADGGASNGSVTVRYGRVNNGSQDLWGWMVMKHTTSTGQCVEHMRHIVGAALDASSCPGRTPSSPTTSG